MSEDRRAGDVDLKTERLLLKPPGAGDADLYRAFYVDAKASRFYGGPLRPDQAWRRLAEDIGHWQLRGFGLWVLHLVDTGEEIGAAGLHWPDGWPSHELTWWLLPGARGQGFASEASRAVIAFAYDRLGWKAVETHMLDENENARRLAGRLGGKVVRRERFADGMTRDVFLLPR